MAADLPAHVSRARVHEHAGDARGPDDEERARDRGLRLHADGVDEHREHEDRAAAAEHSEHDTDDERQRGGERDHGVTPPLSGRGLRLDGAAELVHVERANLRDERVQRGAGQHPRLAEEQQAVTEREQRRDRADLEGSTELRLCLGVDLAEGHVGVSCGCGRVDRGEGTAGTAPGGPEVDEDDAGLLDEVDERLGGEIRAVSWLRG